MNLPDSALRTLRGVASYLLLVLVSVLLIRLPAAPPPSLASTNTNDDIMPHAMGGAYLAWLTDYQRLVRQLVADYRATRQALDERCYIVPVVVHVMHDAGEGNITDEQVADGIRQLNEIFQARHPDTAQVIAYFKPRIGNANIEFRLACLDPGGLPTSGITRHDTPLTRAADAPLKRVAGALWDPSRYLNVWVVIATANGVSGYAYLPCVRRTLDGVVIRHAYLGSIGTAPDLQSRRYTLAHEIGHYLGLRHVGGPDNTTGPGNNNCADDDGVADTPNTEGSALGTCDLTLRACPGGPDSLANVQNIMDYSAGCRAMFTRGQVELMRAGLAGGFPCRASLVRDDNLRRTCLCRTAPSALPADSLGPPDAHRAAVRGQARLIDWLGPRRSAARVQHRLETPPAPVRPASAFLPRRQ